jgi:hypothetical protein
MTILVAMNLGEIAIVAADKKEVAIFDGAIFPLNENAEKIIDTGIGLMTGSGYVSLLDKVKLSTSESIIQSTDDIVNIILQERSAISDEPNLTEAQKNELLSKTGWLFSYITLVGNLRKLRVALYHPSISDIYLSVVEDQTTKVVYPDGISIEAMKSYSEKINREMLQLSQGSIEEVIGHNLSLILSLVDKISRISDTVSSSMDVGIAFMDGDLAMAKAISIHSDIICLVPINS